MTSLLQHQCSDGEPIGDSGQGQLHCPQADRTSGRGLWQVKETVGSPHWWEFLSEEELLPASTAMKHIFILVLLLLVKLSVAPNGPRQRSVPTSDESDSSESPESMPMELIPAVPPGSKLCNCELQSGSGSSATVVPLGVAPLIAGGLTSNTYVSCAEARLFCPRACAEHARRVLSQNGGK